MTDRLFSINKEIQLLEALDVAHENFPTFQFLWILECQSKPSKKFLVSFSTFNPRGEDAVVLKCFPDLFGERAVHASLAVKGRRVTTGAVFYQVDDDGQMTTEAGVVPKTVRIGLRLVK